MKKTLLTITVTLVFLPVTVNASSYPDNIEPIDPQTRLQAAEKLVHHFENECVKSKILAQLSEKHLSINLPNHGLELARKAETAARQVESDYWICSPHINYPRQIQAMIYWNLDQQDRALRIIDTIDTRIRHPQHLLKLYDFLKQQGLLKHARIVRNHFNSLSIKELNSEVSYCGFRGSPTPAENISMEFRQRKVEQQLEDIEEGNYSELKALWNTDTSIEPMTIPDSGIRKTSVLRLLAKQGRIQDALYLADEIKADSVVTPSHYGSVYGVIFSEPKAQDYLDKKIVNRYYLQLQDRDFNGLDLLRLFARNSSSDQWVLEKSLNWIEQKNRSGNFDLVAAYNISNLIHSFIQQNKLSTAKILLRKLKEFSDTHPKAYLSARVDYGYGLLQRGQENKGLRIIKSILERDTDTSGRRNYTREKAVEYLALTGHYKLAEKASPDTNSLKVRRIKIFRKLKQGKYLEAEKLAQKSAPSIKYYVAGFLYTAGYFDRANDLVREGWSSLEKSDEPGKGPEWQLDQIIQTLLESKTIWKRLANAHVFYYCD